MLILGSTRFISTAFLDGSKRDQCARWTIVTGSSRSTVDEARVDACWMMGSCQRRTTRPQPPSETERKGRHTMTGGAREFNDVPTLVYEHTIDLITLTASQLLPPAK